MRTRKFTILCASAFAMIHGKAEANTEPIGTAVSSFQEVDHSTIYYGFNKVYPSSIQMSIINKYMDELRYNPDTYIKVTSHTDAVGDWETNLNVSKKRALVIAEYLRSFGVPQDRIMVDWLGEDAPAFFDKGQLHKNRRTNIKIIRKVKYYPQQQVAQTTTKRNPAYAIAQPVKSNTTTTEKVVTPTYSQKTSSASTPKYRVVEKPSTVVPERRVVIKNKPVVSTQQPTATDFTSKGSTTINQKSIIFIDAVTNQPVQVEVDLNTNKGKTSISTSEKGELKVDLNDLKRDYVDVYAYGYFFKSTQLEKGPGQQIIQLNPTNSGNKIELENLQFVPGKSILLDASDAELERLYLSLMMNPQQKIEVGGHINVPGKTPEELTDKQQQLSVDRAKAVFDYLVKKGISKKRLAYKGYGNSEMIFPDPQTDAEKSRNRRVEIKILN